MMSSLPRGRIYDLSQTLASGMPHYPGDPAPRIEPAPSAPPWRVSALHLGSHSGTHIDAPLHYLPGGAALDAYPPERFVLSGLVVDAPAGADAPIDAAALAAHRRALAPGMAVLLRTGWDRHWGDPAYFAHPHLSAGLVAALLEAQVSLVGIDAPSVDSTVAGAEHAHAGLLGADVLIVENLRGLGALQAGRRYVVVCAPLPVGPLDAAPARVLAWEV